MQSVTLVPSGEVLPWRVEGERLVFRVPEIAGHALVEIKLA